MAFLEYCSRSGDNNLDTGCPSAILTLPFEIGHSIRDLHVASIKRDFGPSFHYTDITTIRCIETCISS